MTYSTEQAASIRKTLVETVPNDDSSREYEKKITQISDKYRTTEDQTILRAIMGEKSDISYKAFYCLATIYRHNRDYTQLRQLIEEAESEDAYRSKVSLKHIRVMYETHSESLYDYDELLSMAHESACELYDNSGYQHTFANAFATICENCLKEDLDVIIKEWYETALFCVNRAIDLEPTYAKYYSTKARIISFKNHFEEANHLLLQAIDKENSEKRDYALLIGNYQFYRAMIAIRKQQWFLEKNRKSEPESHRKVPNFSFSSFQETRRYAFISYSHDDAEIVFEHIRKLKQLGVNLWFDGEIPGGAIWDDEIGKRLKESEMMLLFISQTAVLSRNVRNEIRMAQNHGRPIIPIFIEEVSLSPGAELQLSGYNTYLHYNMSEESFWDKLLNDLDNVRSLPAETPDIPSKDYSQEHLKVTTKKSATIPYGIQVIESLCKGKKDEPELNEDSLVITQDFIAVIDGATSKNEKTYLGKTGGKLAAEFIEQFIRREDFSRMIDGKTAVGRIQKALREYSEEMHFEEMEIHLCASAVIYSIGRRQLWAVGDCQFILNGKLYTFYKKVDEILSQARALAIHMLIHSGQTEESLILEDKARELIMDELSMQKFLENQKGEYGYSVFSARGEIQESFILDVPVGSEVVMASDGYPFLHDTLEKSEHHLFELVKTDPLCYKKYRSTKGLSKDCSVYDDRTYIRFRIAE